MLRASWSALGFVLVAAVAACDGEVSSGSGGGGSGGDGAGGGTTTATGGSTGTTTTGTSTAGPTGCPLAEPAAMETCEADGLRCSYGESAIPGCRRGYRCQDGAWQVDGLGCEDDPADCPSDSPGGTECQEQSSLCVNAALFCVCGPCGGAGCPDPPWSWSCGGPPNTGCPDVIPNDGTACDEASLVCHYGVFCAEEATARCTEGAWTWDEPMACP